MSMLMRVERQSTEKRQNFEYHQRMCVCKRVRIRTCVRFTCVCAGPVWTRARTNVFNRNEFQYARVAIKLARAHSMSIRTRVPACSHKRVHTRTDSFGIIRRGLEHTCTSARVVSLQIVAARSFVRPVNATRCSCAVTSAQLSSLRLRCRFAYCLPARIFD